MELNSGGLLGLQTLAAPRFICWLDQHAYGHVRAVVALLIALLVGVLREASQFVLIHPEPRAPATHQGLSGPAQ
jgi:hypothetical protein